MSSTNFHGAFVFRKQDHGILTATYFNTGEYKPYPETAKLKKATDPENDLFAGDYETTWLEKNDYYVCNLKITPHKTEKGVYKLSWTSSGKTKVNTYEGYGMSENGSLVGFYYFN